MNRDVFDLDPEQQRVFNRLKKVMKDCEKTGILLVNRYGCLHGYDSKLIECFGFEHDISSCEDHIRVNDLDGGDYVLSPDAFADDNNQHYFGLTKKGSKLFNEN